MELDLDQLQDWERGLLKWEGTGSNIPAYSDLSGTVLEPGIRLLALVERHSHADTYTAEHTKIRGNWYEVKVFPTDMKSPKQNQYRKRTIQRNRDRESYQSSVRSGLHLFLIFSLEFNPHQSKWSVIQLERLSLLEKLLARRKFQPETNQTRFWTLNVKEPVKTGMRGCSSYKPSEFASWISLSLRWRYPPSRFGTELEAAAFLGFGNLVKACLRDKNYVEEPLAPIKSLRFAAARGYVDIVKILVDAGTSANPKPWGRRLTPLGLAAKESHFEIAKLLLHAGAEARYLKLHMRNALLHDVVEGGHLKTFRILWNASTCDAGVPIEVAQTYKDPPLLSAVRGAHLEILQILLETGVSVDTRTWQDGRRTALQVAAEQGHTEILQVLLVAGADVNAKPGNNDGLTALQAAAGAGHLDIVRLLLAAKAEVNAPLSCDGYGTTVGRTALQAAAEGGHLDTVRVLLAAKANANALPAVTSGRTALQAAAGGGHINIVQMLLSANAEVNAPPAGRYSRTALQAAAEGGHLDILRVLLAAMGEVNAPPAKIDGRTALQAAAERGHIEIVRLLLEAGADPLARGTNFGQTALEFASNWRHSDIVHLLEEHMGQ